MSGTLEQLSIDQCDSRYAGIQGGGPLDRWYCDSLCRHVEDGDLRLLRLKFDESPEAFTLWNFLLTEEERLKRRREEGKILVGTMKDLGTVPVMAFSFPDVVAFYPDGAWWSPCVMEMSSRLFEVADSVGIDDSFCPVRAMIGAFLTKEHFPIPDHLVCSVGATCDDFSAIAQRLEGLGHQVFWWEIPHRDVAARQHDLITLPGGFRASRHQLEFVRKELERVKRHLEAVAGKRLEQNDLLFGIHKANEIRHHLRELRRLAFTAPHVPLPALELLIAEMLAIHFCSDREEAEFVLRHLLIRVRQRIDARRGYSDADPARIFWVNPVADLRAMNVLEECGGRLCGTDYMFSHALDEIPTNVEPLEALGQMALADPMAGSTVDRANRICREMIMYGSEGLVVSRIPGASHCAMEGGIIADTVKEKLDVPVIEIEVPSLSDASRLSVETRLAALVEMIRRNRTDRFVGSVAAGREL